GRAGAAQICSKHLCGLIVSKNPLYTGSAAKARVLRGASWIDQRIGEAIDLAFAGPVPLVIENGIAVQGLAAVALQRAQIEIEATLGFNRQGPAQRDADDDAFVKAAFAELRRRNIGLGEVGADFHAGGEAAGDLEGDAVIAGQIASHAQLEIE